MGLRRLREWREGSGHLREDRVRAGVCELTRAMAGNDHRHAKDVGRILLGALQDLKHIRGELDGSYRAPGSDVAPAAAVIDRCV